LADAGRSGAGSHARATATDTGVQVTRCGHVARGAKTSAPGAPPTSRPSADGWAAHQCAPA